MKNAGPSQRQLRVGEQVRHAVAYKLQQGILLDDLLKNIVISVAEVRMSPDLKIATCFVSSLSTLHNVSPTDVVNVLNKHSRFIRREISYSLRQMKYMPELRFRLDTSFDNFSKIDSLLRSPEVARDLHHNDEFKD
ncbi:ribosome-binding factor A [Bartonella quintana]|uniref:Ribosome-binding factor A n=4 Tax=Bartonella quintana TaxID=803 RepID=RBFA_BARQU|nr:30S ribosome-binding factor RbfA [Bartonella quintana]Q6G0P3.1 RecName: Full=Ribosome-binding factor A [Bartonella quintana str. Toulouse]AFR25934.1 ribosome-binding factor A [Bartonella quintana RM-11]ETS13477.1 ribosome-binding factor A [Bartonella quintana BQ2-D70]ETS13863.1 ribosome-binding factor A [Bartonella quintana JK 73rel]ETS15550.1 ribosome-binding factor A [Bartonella quintana JK 73]ETS17555.1 ribosome-binding factor A [Bartonella quintana JK 7]ETS18386.1 ribosome-binding fac